MPGRACLKVGQPPAGVHIAAALQLTDATRRGMRGAGMGPAAVVPEDPAVLVVGFLPSLVDHSHCVGTVSVIGLEEMEELVDVVQVLAERLEEGHEVS